MVQRLDDELIHLQAARRMALLEAQAREDADRSMRMLTVVLFILALAGVVLLSWWLQPTPDPLPKDVTRTMVQR